MSPVVLLAQQPSAVGLGACDVVKAGHWLRVGGMALTAAVIIVTTLVVMTTGRTPTALALICALVAAGLLGIATPNELFAGLSNGGVVTIAAMLVIAKGVLHTAWCRA